MESSTIELYSVPIDVQNYRIMVAGPNNTGKTNLMFHLFNRYAYQYSITRICCSENDIDTYRNIAIKNNVQHILFYDSVVQLYKSIEDDKEELIVIDKEIHDEIYPLYLTKFFPKKYTMTNIPNHTLIFSTEFPHMFSDCSLFIIMSFMTQIELTDQLLKEYAPYVNKNELIKTKNNQFIVFNKRQHSIQLLEPDIFDKKNLLLIDELYIEI